MLDELGVPRRTSLGSAHEEEANTCTSIPTTVLVAAGVVAASACGSNAGNTADRDIRLDYAYYNPLSLVVRDQRLLENGGYNVTWALSAGSNKANEGARPRGTEGHLALP